MQSCDDYEVQEVEKADFRGFIWAPLVQVHLIPVAYMTAPRIAFSTWGWVLLHTHELAPDLQPSHMYAMRW